MSKILQDRTALTCFLGLGKALVMVLLARPNLTVVAGVRDPSSSSAKDLHSLPVASATKLIIVKIESSLAGDAKAAVAELQSAYDVAHLDVVIANAGITGSFGGVRDVSAENVQEAVDVNAYGKPAFLLRRASAAFLIELPRARYRF